ncbi:tryptophan synthase beta subunit-like PLP-dependent enzyme [Rhizopogon salebrosus TDB-379]|nr:tryptophan synthase beta subunit-like PLP-dependent enzyme [Rhizopogon salebrosus TDB-379]
MPDVVAQEKVNALQALGADVQRYVVSNLSVKIKSHNEYSLDPHKRNLARRAAIEFGRSDVVKSLENARTSHELQAGSASLVVTTTSSHVRAEGTVDDPMAEDLLSKSRDFFADQFENRSNFDAHYEGTGPELWRQADGHVDAFVSGAGTGGTIAGIGQLLKSMNEEVEVVLVDPEGSGLYNKVKHGVMYDRREAEGTNEGIKLTQGINRMTNNIDLAIPIIDDAFRITDEKAVAMSRYLVQNDGLFLGSSSACNLLACVKFARKKGWRKARHWSRSYATLVIDITPRFW